VIGNCIKGLVISDGFNIKTSTAFGRHKKHLKVDRTDGDDRAKQYLDI
jgi:hypothetical protein